MTTTDRARLRSAAIVGACVVAILSMVLSLRAISTQSDVARREAARAVASVAAQQAAQFASDCRILSIGLLKPGDPQPSTELGRARAKEYAQEYKARGCP